ncbi:putative Ig domain-containing protein [Undibacterium curvum]|uniref:S53 family peptidase n=1 Tax=Undibacterium curvum TaxID=2762294 RepID=UPI003D0D0823
MHILKTASHSPVFSRTVIFSGVMLMLSACGDSSQPIAQNTAVSAAPAAIATGTTTLQAELAVVPAEAANQLATPTFHVAPVLLETPSDLDADASQRTALMPAHQQPIPVSTEYLSPKGLTVDQIRSAQRSFELNASTNATSSANAELKPMATGAVSTYTPAQVRAAYNLAPIPASLTGLTAAQAAQFGAGQTIYIVNAYHDPNIVSELSNFNQKFGLPGCTVKAIATTASLPLPAAPVTGCEFSVVYANAAGGMNSAAPAYNSGWATEIALDVQWAHAIAPLARIVLIEAPDASINSLTGGIALANKMGPGAVSMSFGAVEGSWTASVDAVFGSTNMTYLAATGDYGTQVNWPSVSSKVVAVGGTTLNYSGSGRRTESAWSGTGGGVSAYTAKPAYQTSAVPGMGTPVRRTVADVSMNADPNSGQYVAVINPGSATVNWISAGGTSLSTPQWAGIVAVTNATRALTAKAPLGAVHASLYQQAAVPGNYAKAFADVTSGSHGSCGSCTAKSGYDQLTGLGTPNVSDFVTLMGGSTVATAPVVTGAAISGKVGTALSFTASATAANPVTYTLTGAPAGMTISTAGVVNWATPLAGTYAVTVNATDTKTALVGKAVYTVTIAPAVAPVVSAATITGKAGTALSYNVTTKSDYAVTYSLTGAPAGMSISTAGVISWANPVLGNYSVTVIATDSKTGLLGKGVMSVSITAQTPPVVTAASISGKVGTALSFTVSASSVNPLSYSLTGAPAGMSISSAGVVSWAAPVVGSYKVTVIAKDSKTGLSGQAVYTITIAAAAPTGLTVSAPAITGVAGKAVSGVIAISAPGASWVSISISGAPLGMGFSMSGLNITAIWPAPVTGSYALKITVTDSTGRTTSTTMPITITAK